MTPLMAGTWIKVWRLTDSYCFGSDSFLYSKMPFNNVMDAFIKAVLEFSGKYPDLIPSSWKDVSIKSYLYPRGTKLSWHNDSGDYCGAFTYYVHPKWGSTWGGELVIAEAPPFEQVFDANVMPPHLNHDWEDHYLSIYGMGQWICPKPNRLVLLAPGTFHAINRVDDDAGDNVRCSLQGFFLTK